MSKNNLIPLLVIFMFGYFLRVMYLPNKALTFGYDQARDAYISQQIIDGDLKILGPPASTPGLFHGVLYYYVLAPAYWFGKGSPIIAAYWIAFLNMITVFVVYLLTFLMIKKRSTALLASFLFAISFEATQYAIWLSNPTIAILTVPMMYLGLWSWINKKNKWGPAMTGMGLGLSIQAEVFLLYHMVPLFLWLYVGRKNISKSQISIGIGSLFLSVLTLIIAEIKFGFKGILGATTLLATQESIGSAKSLGDFLILFMNQLGKVYAFSSYPGNVGYGSIFVLGLVLYSLYSWDKTKPISWKPFLATWLLSHITIVSIGGTSTPFLLVGIAPAICILIGIYIAQWWNNQKSIALFVLLVIVFGNLSMIFKENIKGQTIFSIQKDMLLSKQLKAIDYTYERANGEMFSVNSLTSPMWINIVWTYLYDWHGEANYDYSPEWHGKGQEGLLATLDPVSISTEKYFLILEPMAGIPTRYLSETISEENSRSELIEEKYFGELRIQERMRILKYE